MADNDFAYRQEDAEKRRRRREAERQRRLRLAREEYIKKKNEKESHWIGSQYTVNRLKFHAELSRFSCWS